MQAEAATLKVPLRLLSELRRRLQEPSCSAASMPESGALPSSTPISGAESQSLPEALSLDLDGVLSTVDEDSGIDPEESDVEMMIDLPGALFSLASLTGKDQCSF